MKASTRPSRLLLVADRPRTPHVRAADPRVRRFRLARLRVDERPATPAGRHPAAL